MKFQSLYKKAYLAIIVAAVSTICRAESESTVVSSKAVDEQQSFYMDNLQYGANICELPCPPVCPPICPPVCPPVCPINPCDQVCPPVCPPLCPPVCPPNPCDQICPPVNRCADPCGQDNYSDLEVARFFSILWVKIRQAKKQPNPSQAIKALKRKMVKMIRYALQLLYCQGGRQNGMYGEPYGEESLKSLFSSLKWIVCCLNDSNKACFLEYAYGVLYM
ncbi:hypothetical protein NEAUS06_0976 [Nematocida ausubeli]|nr:hypothetical protein NEAUS06_0976 [Nematocida ausubeli]